MRFGAVLLVLSSLALGGHSAYLQIWTNASNSACSGTPDQFRVSPTEVGCTSTGCTFDNATSSWQTLNCSASKYTLGPNMYALTASRLCGIGSPVVDGGQFGNGCVPNVLAGAGFLKADLEADSYLVRQVCDDANCTQVCSTLYRADRVCDAGISLDAYGAAATLCQW